MVARENKNLKEDTGDVEALKQESDQVLHDIQGLQDYVEKVQKHMAQKQSDLKATIQNLKEFEKKNEELKDSIVLLESECRDKGIDPKDNSNHAEEFVLALQARVEAKKDDKHEAEKLKWQEEQKISKKTAKLDKLRRDCNHLIIALDMDKDESQKLMHAEPEVVQNYAQSMNATMQREIRELKKNCDDLQQNLNLCQGEINKKSKEDNQLKNEEIKIQAEKAQLIPCISQEEEDLKFKLKQAKAKMDSYFKKAQECDII